MVYFLGSDCEVWITTETTTKAHVSGGLSTDTIGSASGSGDIFFAAALADTLGPDQATYPAVINLTGVDLSIGAVDEDITYLGIRSVTKAEIKKETTVSLTRKKSDSSWDVVFDQARNGSDGSGVTVATFTNQYNVAPNIESGYRIHVYLRTGSYEAGYVYDEVFSIPNCCVQSHSTSINSDGVSEETLEFMSYVQPNVGNVPYLTATNVSTEL